MAVDLYEIASDFSDYADIQDISYLGVSFLPIVAFWPSGPCHIKAAMLMREQGLDYLNYGPTSSTAPIIWLPYKWDGGGFLAAPEEPDEPEGDLAPAEDPTKAVVAVRLATEREIERLRSDSDTHRMGPIGIPIEGEPLANLFLSNQSRG